ncbi:MAG: methyltransferase domain-containing protein, partial [Candidatus Omnitrophica bacterium]|nr:methyltransferase domain-containing protein [Candidatus Omnitrophota bacterium]
STQDLDRSELRLSDEDALVEKIYRQYRQFHVDYRRKLGERIREVRILEHQGVLDEGQIEKELEILFDQNAVIRTNQDHLKYRETLKGDSEEGIAKMILYLENAEFIVSNVIINIFSNLIGGKKGQELLMAVEEFRDDLMGGTVEGHAFQMLKAELDQDVYERKASETLVRGIIEGYDAYIDENILQLHEKFGEEPSEGAIEELVGRILDAVDALGSFLNVRRVLLGRLFAEYPPELFNRAIERFEREGWKPERSEVREDGLQAASYRPQKAGAEAWSLGLEAKSELREETKASDSKGISRRSFMKMMTLAMNLSVPGGKEVVAALAALSGLGNLAQIGSAVNFALFMELDDVGGHYWLRDGPIFSPQSSGPRYSILTKAEAQIHTQVVTQGAGLAGFIKTHQGLLTRMWAKTPVKFNVEDYPGELREAMSNVLRERRFVELMQEHLRLSDDAMARAFRAHLDGAGETLSKAWDVIKTLPDDVVEAQWKKIEESDAPWDEGLQDTLDEKLNSLSNDLKQIRRDPVFQRAERKVWRREHPDTPTPEERAILDAYEKIDLAIYDLERSRKSLGEFKKMIKELMKPVGKRSELREDELQAASYGPQKAEAWSLKPEARFELRNVPQQKVLILSQFGKFAIPVMRKLMAGNRHRIVGVVIDNASDIFLRFYARKHHIPVFRAPEDYDEPDVNGRMKEDPDFRKRMERFISRVKKTNPDIAVTIGFEILPNEALGIPAKKSLNVHTSSLPKLKGRFPIVRAILEGETEIGVTVHETVEKTDSGKIVYQMKDIPISPEDTSDDIIEKLVPYLSEAILKSVDGLATGQIEMQSQEGESLYPAFSMSKVDGVPLVATQMIDWTLPSEMIARRVRAWHFEGERAETAIRGSPVKIESVKILGDYNPPKDYPARKIVERTGNFTYIIRTGDGYVEAELILKKKAKKVLKVGRSFDRVKIETRSELRKKPTQPEWAPEIQRMLEKKVPFLPVKFSDEGYLFRGIGQGLKEAILTGKYKPYGHNMVYGDLEKEHGIALVSEEPSDATPSFSIYPPDPKDAAYLIFKGSVFNRLLAEGQAAVFRDYGGKYPFIAGPINITDMEYVIVHPETKKWLDRILAFKNPTGENAQIKEKLLEYQEAGVKFVTYEIEEGDKGDDPVLGWSAFEHAFTRFFVELDPQPAKAVRSNIYPQRSEQRESPEMIYHHLRQVAFNDFDVSYVPSLGVRPYDSILLKELHGNDRYAYSVQFFPGGGVVVGLFDAQEPLDEAFQIFEYYFNEEGAEIRKFPPPQEERETREPDFEWAGENPFQSLDAAFLLGATVPRIVVSEEFLREWRENDLFKELLRKKPALANVLTSYAELKALHRANLLSELRETGSQKSEVGSRIFLPRTAYFLLPQYAVGSYLAALSHRWPASPAKRGEQVGSIRYPASSVSARSEFRDDLEFVPPNRREIEQALAQLHQIRDALNAWTEGGGPKTMEEAIGGQLDARTKEKLEKALAALKRIIVLTSLLAKAPHHKTVETLKDIDTTMRSLTFPRQNVVATEGSNLRRQKVNIRKLLKLDMLRSERRSMKSPRAESPLDKQLRPEEMLGKVIPREIVADDGEVFQVVLANDAGEDRPRRGPHLEIRHQDAVAGRLQFRTSRLGWNDQKYPEYQMFAIFVTDAYQEKYRGIGASLMSMVFRIAKGLGHKHFRVYGGRLNTFYPSLGMIENSSSKNRHNFWWFPLEDEGMYQLGVEMPRIAIERRAVEVPPLAFNLRAVEIYSRLRDKLWQSLPPAYSAAYQEVTERIEKEILMPQDANWETAEEWLLAKKRLLEENARQTLVMMPAQVENRLRAIEIMIPYEMELREIERQFRKQRLDFHLSDDDLNWYHAKRFLLRSYRRFVFRMAHTLLTTDRIRMLIEAVERQVPALAKQLARNRKLGIYNLDLASQHLVESAILTDEMKLELFSTAEPIYLEKYREVTDRIQEWETRSDPGEPWDEERIWLEAKKNLLEENLEAVQGMNREEVDYRLKAIEALTRLEAELIETANRLDEDIISENLSDDERNWLQAKRELLGNARASVYEIVYRPTDKPLPEERVNSILEAIHQRITEEAERIARLGLRAERSELRAEGSMKSEVGSRIFLPRIFYLLVPQYVFGFYLASGIQHPGSNIQNQGRSESREIMAMIDRALSDDPTALEELGTRGFVMGPKDVRELVLDMGFGMIPAPISFMFQRDKKTGTDYQLLNLVISEMTTNFEHAGPEAKKILIARRIEEGGVPAVEIIAADSGSGIVSIENAMLHTASRTVDPSRGKGLGFIRSAAISYGYLEIGTGRERLLYLPNDPEPVALRPNVSRGTYFRIVRFLEPPKNYHPVQRYREELIDRSELRPVWEAITRFLEGDEPARTELAEKHAFVVGPSEINSLLERLGFMGIPAPLYYLAQGRFRIHTEYDLLEQIIFSLRWGVFPGGATSHEICLAREIAEGQNHGVELVTMNLDYEFPIVDSLLGWPDIRGVESGDPKVRNIDFLRQAVKSDGKGYMIVGTPKERILFSPETTERIFLKPDIERGSYVQVVRFRNQPSEDYKPSDFYQDEIIESSELRAEESRKSEVGSRIFVLPASYFLLPQYAIGSHLASIFISRSELHATSQPWLTPLKIDPKSLREGYTDLELPYWRLPGMKQPPLREFLDEHTQQRLIFSLPGDPDRWMPLYDEENNQVVIAHLKTNRWQKTRKGNVIRGEEILEILEDFLVFRLEAQDKLLDQDVRKAGFADGRIFYYAKAPPDDKKHYVKSPVPLHLAAQLPRSGILRGGNLVGLIKSPLSTGDLLTVLKPRLKRYATWEIYPDDDGQKVNAYLLTANGKRFILEEDRTKGIRTPVMQTGEKKFLPDIVAFDRRHGGREMAVLIGEQGTHNESQTKKKDRDALFVLEDLAYTFLGERVPRLSRITFHLDRLSVSRTSRAKKMLFPDEETALKEGAQEDDSSETAEARKLLGLAPVYIPPFQRERIHQVVKTFPHEDKHDKLNKFLLKLQRIVNFTVEEYQKNGGVFELPNRISYSVFEAPGLGNMRFVVEFEKDNQSGKYQLLDAPVREVETRDALRDGIAVKILPPFKPIGERLREIHSIIQKLPEERIDSGGLRGLIRTWTSRRRIKSSEAKKPEPRQGPGNENGNRSELRDLNLKDKTVVFFPGASPIHVGLARDLYERYDVFRRVLDEADAVSGFDLKRMLFEGPQADLDRAKYIMPITTAISYGLYQLLQSEFHDRIPVGAMVGNSLGQVVSMVVAGVLSFEDGVRYSHMLGSMAEEILGGYQGSMAMVAGLPKEEVKALADKYHVEISGVFSDRVVHVSGLQEGLDPLRDEAISRGATVIDLGIHYPVHSSRMQSIRPVMEKMLGMIQIRPPRVAVISNNQGKVIQTAEEARAELLRQVTEPVLWNDALDTVLEAGAASFVELGILPKRYLLRWIPEGDIEKYYLHNADSVQALQRRLQNKAEMRSELRLDSSLGPEQVIELMSAVEQQLQLSGVPGGMGRGRIVRFDKEHTVEATYNRDERTAKITVVLVPSARSVSIRAYVDVVTGENGVEIRAFTEDGEDISQQVDLTDLKYRMEKTIDLSGDWTEVLQKVLEDLRFVRTRLWARLYPEFFDKDLAGHSFSPERAERPPFPLPSKDQLIPFYEAHNQEGLKPLSGDRDVPVGMVQLSPRILDAYRGWINDLGDHLKILSLGSGRGQLERALMEGGHSVTAVDLSEKNARFSKALGVKTIVADVHQPLDLKEKYDLVIIIDAIGQMDPPVIFEQAKKYLRNGGKLLVTTPQTKTQQTVKEYQESLYIRYSADYLLKAMKDAGFELGTKGSLVIPYDPRGISLQYYTARLPSRSEQRSLPFGRDTDKHFGTGRSENRQVVRTSAVPDQKDQVRSELHQFPIEIGTAQSFGPTAQRAELREEEDLLEDQTVADSSVEKEWTPFDELVETVLWDDATRKGGMANIHKRNVIRTYWDDLVRFYPALGTLQSGDILTMASSLPSFSGGIPFLSKLGIGQKMSRFARNYSLNGTSDFENEISERLQSGRSIRVAAFAPGMMQEPIIILMAIMEQLKRLETGHDGFELAIDVYDKRDQTGVFGKMVRNEIYYDPRDIVRIRDTFPIEQYFERQDRGYRLKDEIHQMFTFHALDLADDEQVAQFHSQGQPYDFMFLNNMLAYVPLGKRMRVFDLAHDRLKDDGVLYSTHFQSRIVDDRKSEDPIVGVVGNRNWIAQHAKGMPGVWKNVKAPTSGMDQRAELRGGNFPVPKPEEVVGVYQGFDEWGYKRLPTEIYTLGYVSGDAKWGKWFIDFVNGLGEKMEILSVGSGAGQNEVMLQEAGHQVTGMDLSPNLVKFSRERGVETILQDIHRLPARGKKYDLILFSESIGHMDLEVVLKRARARLKKYGHILMTLPIPKEGTAYERYQRLKFIQYTPEQVREAAQKAGLEVVPIPARKLKIRFGSRLVKAPLDIYLLQHPRGELRKGKRDLSEPLNSEWRTITAADAFDRRIHALLKGPTQDWPTPFTTMLMIHKSNLIRTFWDELVEQFPRLAALNPHEQLPRDDGVTLPSFQSRELPGFWRYDLHQRIGSFFRDMSGALGQDFKGQLLARFQSQKKTSVLVVGPGLMQEPIAILMLAHQVAQEAGLDLKDLDFVIHVMDKRDDSGLFEKMTQNKIYYDPADIAEVEKTGFSPSDYFDREKRGFRLKPEWHAYFRFYPVDLDQLDQMDGHAVAPASQDFVFKKRVLGYLKDGGLEQKLGFILQYLKQNGVLYSDGLAGVEDVLTVSFKGISGIPAVQIHLKKIKKLGYVHRYERISSRSEQRQVARKPAVQNQQDSSRSEQRQV